MVTYIHYVRNRRWWRCGDDEKTAVVWVVSWQLINRIHGSKCSGVKFQNEDDATTD